MRHLGTSNEIRWKQVGTTLAVVLSGFLLLVVLSRLVHRQLAPWRYAHALKARDPGIDAVLRSAPGDEVKPLGQRVPYGELSLALPWPDVERERVTASGTRFWWRDGAYVELANPAVPSYPLREPRSLVSSLSGRDLSSPQTNCDVARAAFATTTDQIKWWNTRRQNAQLPVLLTVKALFRIGVGQEVSYAVQSGRLCGIQQGTPGQTTDRIRLDLFDEGHDHYQITLHPAERTITQAEVNGLLASFRVR